MDFGLQAPGPAHSRAAAQVGDARAISLPLRAQGAGFGLQADPVVVQGRVFLGKAPQLVEHGGDLPRHADLVGLGMVGLDPLHGDLDVKGWWVRPDGQDASSRLPAAAWCRPAGRGPAIDVTGPIQAAGTPHPDWCRPLEVHGRRFARSRPGMRLTQVVERVIGNVDGPAAAGEPDRDSTAMPAANSEQTPIETY
jgi:hypothetical protein